MKPDFGRKLYCVMGLPFDAVDLPGAVGKMRTAVRERTRCLVSTPNVNFVVAAQNDAAFRDSVLHSDLSLADGMPLVWVARLMGVPLKERVAGSAVFESLQRIGGPSMNVFFFGGADGVAERACERLNAQGGGLRCVGFESPGFGAVEAMSSDDLCRRINASAADFVVVALGARKGQAWIEHNRAQLDAPLISHLGAVLNFVAGTVRRAPSWMQRVGLEWLWRIREEPALWRRHAGDAVALVRLVLVCAIPYALHARWRAPTATMCSEAQVSLENSGSHCLLRLRGAWVERNLDRLRPLLLEAAQCEHSVAMDLSEVSHVDSAFIGLMSLLWTHKTSNGQPLQVGRIQPAVRRTFRQCCAQYMLMPGAGDEKADVRTVWP